MNLMNDRQRGLDPVFPLDEGDQKPAALRTRHIVFPDARTAEYLVAGLPLAARLVHALSLDGAAEPRDARSLQPLRKDPGRLHSGVAMNATGFAAASRCVSVEMQSRRAAQWCSVRLICWPA